MKRFALYILLLASPLALAQTSGLKGPIVYAVASGSVNTLAVTQPGAVLTVGQVVTFLPNLANTTTTPTLAVNGLTAKTITKNGQVALAAGDLITTAIATVIYDGTDWELQNPQTLSSGAGSPACGSATGCLALPEGSTAGTPTSGHDYIRADATQHNFLESLNGGAETLLPGTPVAVPTTLTAQVANVTSATIYTTPAADHYYQVCAEANITRAATTSSTLVQIQIDYTSSVDNVTKVANIGTSPGSTGNGTFVDNSGCVLLHVKASTTIQWATVSYASSGATTMQYSLSGTVQFIQ